jgi:hypothetical protein
MKFKRKSVYSVREAVEMAFEKMDHKFHSIRICQAVREITARPFLMDGSILRRLREAREDNPTQFGYICEDNESGIYRKQPLKSAELV